MRTNSGPIPFIFQAGELELLGCLASIVCPSLSHVFCHGSVTMSNGPDAVGLGALDQTRESDKAATRGVRLARREAPCG